VKTTIAVLDKHGNSAVEAAFEALRELYPQPPGCFKIALPSKTPVKAEINMLIKQDVKSSALVAFAASDPKAFGNLESLALDDASLILEGRIYSPIAQAEELEKLAKQTVFCENILQNFIQQADGDYTFFMIKKDSVAAARDPIGVQPLYYGENKEIIALATNRKALWKMGIERAVSFPPGNLAFINKKGIQFREIKNLEPKEPQKITLSEASKQLQILLEQSVQSRIRGLKEVAVAFSGGLDSSLVAFLAKKCGVKVHLVHVSLENQPETEEAIKAADLLDLPIQISLYKESDVEAVLPKVVDLIEEADPVKASIGVPFYWVAETAAETGFKVMLAGQGADELFGGYQRYVTEYCEAGDEKVRQTMFNDVANIYESNLERDMKICGFHDIELRVPFGQFELAEFAMGLPCELKFERKADSQRKILLRNAALDFGLPKMMAAKPKKAVQYSTGINNAVKHIAKKNGKTVNQFITDLFLQSKAKIENR
jgi:asparagine synthase (glutamine-hydrolysing)